MMHRESDPGPRGGEDRTDERLEQLLAADRLSPAERARMRAHVLRAVDARPRRRVRLFRWSLVPAAAAGLLLGVMIARAFRPEPPPDLQPDRSSREAAVPTRPDDRVTPAIPDAGNPPARRPGPEPAVAEPVRDRSVIAGGLTESLTVQGSIVDLDGRPVANALVAGLGELEGSLTQVAPTGHFLLRMRAAPVTSSFLHVAPPPGLGLRHIVYRHVPGAPVQLSFQPGRPLRGQITDAETGRPLPDARIERTLFWDGRLVSRDSAMSTAAGFTLDPMPVLLDAERADVSARTVVQLAVLCPGYATRLTSCRSAEDLAEILARPLALHRGGRVSVLITTPDGYALPDALVQLSSATPRVDPFTYRAPSGPRTNADGRVDFESVPAGAVRVAAAHRDARPEPSVETTVPAGGTATVRLTLTPGRQIGGRVLDAGGQPLVSAVLFALADTASESRPGLAHGPLLTDEKGRFLFTGLPPGAYTVHAYHFPAIGPEYAARRRAGVRTGRRDVTLRLEPSAVNLVLDVREARTGAPVADATVTLLGPGGRAIRRPTRLSDGRLIVRGVDPGRTAVQVLAPGYLPSALRRLALPAGPARVVVTVRLHRPSHVAGVVVDQSGRPVAEALVLSGREEVEPIRPDHRSFHSAGFLRTAVTDANGRFTLAGLRVLSSRGHGLDLTVVRPGRPAFAVRGLTLLQGESLEGLRITVP